MERVSAVIPAYNAGQFISRALDSLLGQSLQLNEIIIVNDGSTDDTSQVLERYFGQFDMISVINQKNAGVSAARNTGIKKAKNDYILMLDADDTFSEYFLEQAMPALLDKNVDVVTCGINKIKDEKNLFSWIPEQSKTKLPYVLFENIAPACCLFKKEVFINIGFYDETFLSGFEDWDLNIRIVISGYKYHVLNQYLFNYYRTENSRSTGANLNERKIRKKLLNKYKEYYSQHLEDYGDYWFDQRVKSNREAIKIKAKLEYRLGSYIIDKLRQVKYIFKKVNKN